MASNNPDITVSDITTDVEARLGTPNISASVYLPWVSYAYQKTFQALLGVGQGTKEKLFGELASFNLTAGVAEYSLETNIPRFGGIIKVEVKYGGSGDDWIKATQLPSISMWTNQNNVSTSYRSKATALYYLLNDIIGFIPTPPSTDSSTPLARVWYIKRPYQLTLVGDIIDIPYRFIYPVVNYVQSKAVEKLNEDYTQSTLLERKFQSELEQIAIAASSEFDENAGNFIQDPGADMFYNNPIR